MKRIAFVRGSEGHSVKMHFSISNCFTGCRIWVVVAFFADLRVDAALCIDPSFDELFRGLKSAVVVSTSDLVPAVVDATKNDFLRVALNERASDVCSSDSDGPYCGALPYSTRSRRAREFVVMGCTPSYFIPKSIVDWQNSLGFCQISGLDGPSFMERSTIFVGSPGFDAFADALRAASAKAISRSLPPDETIKIINAELEGYEPGERIGTEIDQDHVPEFPVRDDASVEDDTMLFGEKPLLQPLNAGIKSDTSVAQVLVSGPKSISPSSKHASDEIEYHPSGPHVKFASDDVAATFMGPWFGGAGGLGVRLDGVGRIRFTRPVVVRSIKGIGEKQLYVFGKRGSSESWRRIIRSEQSHFECDTGDVVWIKSRKDGRRHVAKVTFASDETLTVNWADGDATYRTMARRDSECQKVTSVWNTRAVDEVVLIASSQFPWLLVELTVAVSTSGDDDPRLLVRITRSGVILLDRIAPGADVVSIDDVVKAAAHTSILGRTIESIEDIVLVGKSERPSSRPSLRPGKGVARPHSLRVTVADRSFMGLLKFAKALESGKYVVSETDHSYIIDAYKAILARMTLRGTRDFKRHIHFEDFLIREWDRPAVSGTTTKASLFKLDILSARYHDWLTSSSQSYHPCFEDEVRVVGEYYCESSGRGTPFELLNVNLDVSSNTALGTFAFEHRDLWYSYEVGGIWEGVSQTLYLEPINDPSVSIPEGFVAVPLHLTFYEDHGDYLQGSIGALGCDAIYGKLVPPISPTTPDPDIEERYSAEEVKGPLVDVAEEIDNLRSIWRSSLFGKKIRGSSMLPDSSDTVIPISL